MYNMGWCYENGKGVSVDYDKAIEWYQKANNSGNNCLESIDRVKQKKQQSSSVVNATSSNKNSTTLTNPPEGGIWYYKLDDDTDKTHHKWRAVCFVPNGIIDITYPFVEQTNSETFAEFKAYVKSYLKYEIRPQIIKNEGVDKKNRILYTYEYDYLDDWWYISYCFYDDFNKIEILTGGVYDDKETTNYSLLEIESND